MEKYNSEIKRKSLKECICEQAKKEISIRTLPLLHMSKISNIFGIFRKEKLIPNCCDVFEKKIIYLFYGSARYQYKTSEESEFDDIPVVFMFNGDVSIHASEVFPFDSGGVYSGCYGRWDEVLSSLNDFSILGTGKNDTLDNILNFIRCAFGDNLEYLQGNSVVLNAEGNSEEKSALIELLKFYQDKNQKGDPRKRTIECQFDTPIEIKDKLICIACPINYERKVKKLLMTARLTVPVITYIYHQDEDPVDAQKSAQNIIEEFIKKNYL